MQERLQSLAGTLQEALRPVSQRTEIRALPDALGNVVRTLPGFHREGPETAGLFKTDSTSYSQDLTAVRTLYGLAAKCL